MTDQITTLDVLVPVLGSVAGKMIDAGSGIVSANVRSLDGHRLEVYFEGNRYKSAGLNTFAARVKHAAGRLSQRYPTIAVGWYPPADFVQVGTFTFSADWRHTQLTITDAAALRSWVGEDQ